MIASARGRALVLGGVAVLAIAIALGIVQATRHTSSLGGAGSWYTALAAPYTATTATRRTACGVLLGPKTLGVAHPVLPCGVKLYIEFGGKSILTKVIDRGHTVPGHDFDLTLALAHALGLQGVQTIRWRFAR